MPVLSGGPVPTIVQSKFGSSQRVGAAPVRLLGTRLRETGWHARVSSSRRSGVGVARAGLEARKVEGMRGPMMIPRLQDLDPSTMLLQQRVIFLGSQVC